MANNLKCASDDFEQLVFERGIPYLLDERYHSLGNTVADAVLHQPGSKQSDFAESWAAEYALLAMIPCTYLERPSN
jgi:hypothetical protein